MKIEAKRLLQKKHTGSSGSQGAKDIRYFRGDWFVAHLFVLRCCK